MSCKIDITNFRTMLKRIVRNEVLSGTNCDSPESLDLSDPMDAVQKDQSGAFMVDAQNIEAVIMYSNYAPFFLYIYDTPDHGL